MPPDPGRHRPAPAGPRLLTLPAALRTADLQVRPVAVVAVILVTLIAAAIFGVRWWRAEQGSTPVPVAPVAAEPSPEAPAPVPDAAHPSEGPGAIPSVEPSVSGAGSTAAPVEASADVIVHVAGEVHQPGVVTVPAGSRVRDAVDAAGGLTSEADTSRINLARPVTDGERIWLPHPGQEVPPLSEPATPAPGGPLGQGVDPAAEPPAREPININTADQAVLEELPGVGPVTAGAIVQWRTDHGGFSTPDELLEVSGIGEATLEKLRPHVTL